MISQTFVDLGERRLSLMTAGQGTPLVILEARAGDASTTWQGIFQAVAHFTQVLAYDRAGLGQSDATPRPRTAWQLTDDLVRLLRLAQYAGPYVLVGHSLGALLCRLYAQWYPQEVAGLVLVDGPHPEQGNTISLSLDADGAKVESSADPAATPGIKRRLSPARASWLYVSRSSTLDEKQRGQIEQIRAGHADLETAYQLTQTFVTMLADHRETGLDDWLTQAEHCGIKELKSFAQGIRRDYTAVRATFTSMVRRKRRSTA